MTAPADPANHERSTDMKFELDPDYWDRQFPADVLKQLAENGKACTDANGFPLEDMDPVPVIRLFMADGPGLTSPTRSPTSGTAPNWVM
jgi:hypothetical protein